MSEAIIIMYGSDWCGDCRRARRFFERHAVPYQWINVDKDRDGEAFVIQTNQGMRRVPTIIFPDGSLLVEPSNNQLAAKLNIVIEQI